MLFYFKALNYLCAGLRSGAVNAATASSVSGSCDSIDEIGGQSLNCQNSIASDTSDMISSLTRDMSILSTSPVDRGGGAVTRDVSLSSRGGKDGSLSPVSLKSEIMMSTGPPAAAVTAVTARSRTASPSRSQTDQKEPQVFKISTTSLNAENAGGKTANVEQSKSAGVAMNVNEKVNVEKTSTSASGKLIDIYRDDLEISHV